MGANILEGHAKDKPLGADVDLRGVMTNHWFLEADLANLMNECATCRAR